MDDEPKKTYRIVDHANKRADSRGFDPYQFWLDQVRRISEQRGASGKDGDKKQAGKEQVGDKDKPAGRAEKA